MVSTRDNEHVRWRLRLDVAKGDRLVGLTHDIGRNPAAGNAAKQAGVLCHVLTLRSPVHQRDHRIDFDISTAAPMAPAVEVRMTVGPTAQT